MLINKLKSNNKTNKSFLYDDISKSKISYTEFYRLSFNILSKFQKKINNLAYLKEKNFII